MPAGIDAPPKSDNLHPSKPNGDAVMSNNKMSGADSLDEHCPDGECDMRSEDISFAHQFGTFRITPFLQCNICLRTEPMPEPEY